MAATSAASPAPLQVAGTARAQLRAASALAVQGTLRDVRHAFLDLCIGAAQQLLAALKEPSGLAPWVQKARRMLSAARLATARPHPGLAG